MTNKPHVRNLESFQIVHVNRISGLAERRARRRVKRAILSPVESDPPKDDDHSEVDKKSKRTGPKKKKAKIDSELTLMHSFSAKNIGKARLTVRYFLLYDYASPNWFD